MVKLSISLGVSRIRARETTHRVRGDGVSGSTRHWTASHYGEVLLIVDRRFRVQTFLWSNMSESWVGGGLLEVGSGRVRARVVADQVKVLAS